jgi:hypothetical protein
MSTSKKVIVKISEPLRQFFALDQLYIFANDYSDVVSCLLNQFPLFANFYRSIESKSKFQDIAMIEDRRVINTSLYSKKLTKDTEIFLVPLIFGNQMSYSDYYSELSSSFIYPLFGLSTASYESSDLEGLDKRILDSSLFGNAEQIYDVDVRKNNDSFGVLKITNNANLPVPIIYGMTRASGTVINTYIKNYRADPDIFRVKDVMIE